MGCGMTLKHEIVDLVRRLDGLGFDIGNYRISLYRAVLIVVVTVGIILLGRLASLLVRSTFRRMKRLSVAQQLLGEKLSCLLVWTLLILAGIDLLGISLTALTVFSGAFGLAIGFGLQKTFGNLISGIILLMDGSIKPGDVIAVGEGASKTVGQVSRIGIRSVSVITRDKIEYLIPNEQLMTSQVENWSFSSRDVRVKVPISVAYGTDLDFAEKLMLDAVSQISRVIDQHPPAVWLNKFGENAIEFEIQLWIDDPEDGLGNLRSDVLKAVWKSFKANGIEVPFPQMDLHVKSLPPAPDHAPSRHDAESPA